MLVNITADITCKYNGTKPAYRLWLDEHLVNEREFIWSSMTTAIREHISVEVTKGIHELKVENVGYGAAVFSIDNIVVNGIPAGCKFRV